jgi:hypothetical protein
MGRRLSQLCPPYATPSSNSSLDYRRSDARIVENGFATSGGLSESAKVVLVREIIAKRIIEVARDGERDPDELCVRAVKALGFSSFSNRQIVWSTRRDYLPLYIQSITRNLMETHAFPKRPPQLAAPI